MKVYLLDRHGKTREQILEWLLEDKRSTGVEVFEDYIQFIELVEASPPDFCIIRLGWDGIPGIKTADMVRQISADIRIVFISDTRDYALDAFEARADCYLLCPVKKDKLMKCLHGDFSGGRIKESKSDLNGGQI